jgi:hypothetical protein
MRSAIWAAATAALMVSGGAQAANLVQNGSFEDHTLSSGQVADIAAGGYVGFQVTLPGDAYSNAVDHWTSAQSPANPYAFNLYFFDGATAKTGDALSQWTSEQQRPNENFTGSSPDGGSFMVLDGDPGFTGPFSQTIDGLNVGSSYKLSFWWAGGELSNRTGYTSITLTGTFGSDPFSTPTFNNSKPSGVAGDFSGWQLVSFTFKASAASQVLSFLASGTAPTPNLPPVAFLDGVSLTAVPEPATWGMMILGFGALGAVARRRRAQTGAA